MIKERNLLSYLLLTFLTCGIYPIFWGYQMATDANTMLENDGSDPILYALLAGFLSPIYVCIIAYRMNLHSHRVGIVLQRSWAFHMVMWVLSTLTCGITGLISYFYFISDFNLITFAHNNMQLKIKN